MAEIINMFNELSKSKDWRVTKFRVTPKKTNNWKSLTTGTDCPKVGDLLFGFHNGRMGGKHDHVAIYLGLHGGHRYVAEGFSVSGRDVNEMNKKVQVARIEDSRLALETDIISHFAHCKKYEVQQTETANESNGLASSQKEIDDYIYTTAFKLKHFKIVLSNKYDSSNLLYSDKARENNIKNMPEKKDIECLVNLIIYILDPLYEVCEQKGWGKLYVSSGYRNQELNTLVKGSSSSQHMAGQAADIQLTVNNRENLLKLVNFILTHEQYEYDQLILENVNNTTDLLPEWVHISYKRPNYGKNRKELKYMYNNSYYPISPSVITSKF